MRLKKIIIILILSFGFSNACFASGIGKVGVCKGFETNSYSICNTSETKKITIGDKISKEGLDDTYFLSPGYYASDSNGNSVSAFCLDPGLPKPDSQLEMIRPIDNTSGTKEYDEGIYKIYQNFYKNLIDNKYNNVNYAKAYFEYAVRIWTLKNGFDYLSKEDAEYVNDSSYFKWCSNQIDSSIDGGTESKIGCFYNDDNKENIKTLYNSKNNDYVWENPLNITTKFEKDDSTNIYTFSFTVSFEKDTNKFFDEYSKGYSGLISSAQFNLKNFTTNTGVVIDSTNSYDYSGGGTINSGNQTRTYIVKLTQNQYNNLGGNVSITMNYSYRHPFNIENLYIARYDLYNTSQRMLIIQDYLHEDSITLKSNNISSCSHNGYGDYTLNNGSSSTSLTEYISSCSCDKVNTTYLYYTDTEKNIYNSSCGETFSSELDDCVSTDSFYKADSIYNFSNYKSSYTTATTNINNYCTKVCTEEINVKNLKNRFSTISGTYFEFYEYPQIIASKTCTVNVDYTNFLNDYKSKLIEVINAYNDYKDEKAASESEKTHLHCCKGYDCDDDGVCYCRNDKEEKVSYSYRYVSADESIYGYSSSDDNLVEVKSSSSRSSSCGGSLVFDVEGKKAIFDSKLSELNSLISQLKSCNNELGLGYDYTSYKEKELSNAKFYNFGVDLSFNYEQSLVDVSNIFTNDYDKEFYFDKSEENNQSEKSNLRTYGSFKSETNDASVENKKVAKYIKDGETKAERTVTYNVNFNLNVDKYTDVLTSKITTSSNSGKNLNIGKVYDTKFDAIEATNNFYYEFSSLGDLDNKKIFDFIRNNNNSINNEDKSTYKRYCEYKTINNIIKINNKNEPYLNFSYRIVDPKNIDPNKRASNTIDDDGMANWDVETINKIQGTDIFNPDNLEYSFTLDSNTIELIKDYNDNNSYDNDSLTGCDDDGNGCKSSFITELTKSDSSIIGTKSKVATNISGRDKSS